MKKYIAILLLIPNILFAQNDLSLLQAIEIGMWSNFDIQVSSRNQDINRVNNNWASAGALPTLNIGVKREEALSDQSNKPASIIQETLRSTSYNGNANIS